MNEKYLINQLFTLIGYATGIASGYEMRFKEEGIIVHASLSEDIRYKADVLMKLFIQISDKEPTCKS